MKMAKERKDLFILHCGGTWKLARGRYKDRHGGFDQGARSVVQLEHIIVVYIQGFRSVIQLKHIVLPNPLFRHIFAIFSSYFRHLFAIFSPSFRHQFCQVRQYIKRKRLIKFTMVYFSFYKERLSAASSARSPRKSVRRRKRKFRWLVDKP